MPVNPVIDEDVPLEQFNQCHAGIRQHLDVLGGLPALADAARRARDEASGVLEFFRKTMRTHHEEEERELFPAVQHAASGGEEAAYVKTMAERLTREHRQLESQWARLEAELKKVAHGRDARLDAAAVQALVAAYRAHADYEEQAYLPLAQRILSRNGDEMAALALSLHLRHVMPDVMQRYGHRI